MISEASCEPIEFCIKTLLTIDVVVALLGVTLEQSPNVGTSCITEYLQFALVRRAGLSEVSFISIILVSEFPREGS